MVPSLFCIELSVNMNQLGKPIGNVLKQAGLISDAQLEVALREQSAYSDLRLGEICALHGWLDQQTADFFAEVWPRLLRESKDKTLGYYLKTAALLDEQQMTMILKEQSQTGMRIGAIAVLRGWLKQSTLDFFLKYLAPTERSESPFMRKPKKPSDTSPGEITWAEMQAKSLDDVKWLG
jgi:hypothetical protein